MRALGPIAIARNQARTIDCVRLPRHDRFAHHAFHRHRAPRLHGLPRRACRRSAARGRAERLRAYEQAKKQAHPQPSIPGLWRSSANPVRPFADWLKESKEYIQFVNPGDLRVAVETCGSGATRKEVRAVRTSMMTHGAMLWQAALYNNGGFPLQRRALRRKLFARWLAAAHQTCPAAIAGAHADQGRSPASGPARPLGSFAARQHSARVRARRRERSEIGNPNPNEDPGAPDDKLSDRGLGTQLRTDPVFLGLQKTRLLDPILSLPGTNDHPGDYRNSGCTACHVIYANDRSPVHSGPYAAYGNQGAQRADRPDHSEE